MACSLVALALLLLRGWLTSVFRMRFPRHLAWSSTREPEQVFILLQSIYGAFDDLAKRRKVFKVETIGDSYMAVTGLPDPMENHAVTMVRFAGKSETKRRNICCLRVTHLHFLICAFILVTLQRTAW